MTTAPDSTSWTLRLKSHKTTVLLQINPLHTFETIKKELYTALRDTGLRDLKDNDIPLPASAEDIQLGRPVNINDPRSGFVIGEWEPSGNLEVEAEDANLTGKGKGKGRPKKNIDADSIASSSNIRNCPKGANLKDGAVLAFRWQGPGMEDAWDEDETLGLDSDDDEKKISTGIVGVKSMWAVKIASFEDSYGVENEGDLGGGGEFEG